MWLFLSCYPYKMCACVCARKAQILEMTSPVLLLTAVSISSINCNGKLLSNPWRQYAMHARGWSARLGVRWHIPNLECFLAVDSGFPITIVDSMSFCMDQHMHDAQHALLHDVAERIQVKCQPFTPTPNAFVVAVAAFAPQNNTALHDAVMACFLITTGIQNQNSISYGILFLHLYFIKANTPRSSYDWSFKCTKTR